MASTYSTNLGIELPGTGDQAGVWGNTTNTNLGTLIEQAISGYVTQAVATGTDTTITIPNGATGVARNMYIELTGTGGASTNLIVPANKKLYFIFNNTSSGQVTVKVSGQTGISVPNGKKMILVSNGTDIVTAENYVASLSSDNLTLTGTLAVGSTSTFTGAATFTANPTLSGGTANGVLYLNGSKVATSGSALTFDGTNLALTTANSIYRVPTAGGFLFDAGGNNGIYILGSSNYVAVYTGGTEQMRLTSTGLGIGTASPGQKLEVAGNILVNTSGNPYAEIKTSGSGNNPYLKLTADTNSWTFQGTFSNANDDLLVLYNATTLLDLDKNGNLGLGVTPSAWGASKFAMQLGARASLYGANNLTVLANNYYDNGTNNIYIATAAASDYYQSAGSHVWRIAASGTAGNAITFTQAMTLDSSGNLGLGVTPSAWGSGRKMLQFPNGSCVGDITNFAALGQNWYHNGTSDLYIANGFATRYYTGNGQHVWNVAPSGTAGNAITFTQAMTLDASGRLLVGRTSSDANGYLTQILGASGYQAGVLLTYSGVGSGAIFENSSGALVFGNDNASGTTERARIDSSGNLGLGVTPSAWGGVKALQIGAGAIAGSSAATDISANSYYDGTNFRYISSFSAVRYQQNVGAGEHQWFTAPSGTAGNTISWTQALTLGNSGNLGVGTTSPAAILSGSNVVVDASATAGAEFVARRSGGGATLVTGVTNSNTGYLWMSTNTALLFGTNNTERARINSDGDVIIGSTVAPVGNGLAVNSGVSSSSVTAIEIQQNTTGAVKAAAAFGVSIQNSGEATNAADLFFSTASGGSLGERARITSGGDLLIGKTGANLAAVGVELRGGNADSYFVVNDASSVLALNRETADGDLIRFFQGSTSQEGSISVSGATVSYNAFAGSHWSQLQDGSKPDILRGTVMESINELCVWPGEDNERLPKAKISDTAGSKKVYGVFMAWEPNWDTTNDMLITSVGAFICRVNGSVTVQEGDLLESNGDGTARVQADDIIRSSTIGKVTSTVKTHQYDDGSYCVPTVLYCG